MDRRLEKDFDLNLREVPRDPLGLREYVDDLQKSLLITSDIKTRVIISGELGVHLRTLGDLNAAERILVKALEDIQTYQLDIIFEVQQKIRLGQVYQWQRRFELSNSLFDEVIVICRSGKACKYLDFALQHAGKNLFDQNRLEEAQSFFEEALSLRIKRDAVADQVESSAFAIQRVRQILSEECHR